MAGTAGVLLSLVFAPTTLTFLANQVAAGLAVGILGLGMSAIIGRNHESLTLSSRANVNIPVLSDILLLGPVLFQQNIVEDLTFILAIVIGVTVKYARLGLAIRSVGEHPHAAQALGFAVFLIRYGAVAFGGLLAGFAGAYESTIHIRHCGLTA